VCKLHPFLIGPVNQITDNNLSRSTEATNFCTFSGLRWIGHIGFWCAARRKLDVKLGFADYRLFTPRPRLVPRISRETLTHFVTTSQ
jgi:hypothetical protein